MSNNIKVMHVTYDMRIGGTEMVIKNIIDGCDTTVFDMSILCIESPLGPFADELRKKGIRFIELDRKPNFDISLIKQIRQEIKKNSIDILHCHQYTPWVYGVLAAAFSETKVVLTEHGRFYPDRSSWKRKLINPFLNLMTKKVTAISNATKEALVEFENIPRKSIQVIYNGIAPLNVKTEDVSALKNELKIAENNIVLGTIARFDPIKNHPMMLKAFAQVLNKYPHTTLLIVGDGEERATIESWINELNINHNVILTGYQAKPEHYLAMMDVYLLSSFSEGTSMTLLEAMSLSKPCIVTAAGGNPEIIKDKENGYVTPNNDTNAFAQAIIRAISTPSHRIQLGNKSKEMFSQQFSEQQMNKHYSQLYSEL